MRRLSLLVFVLSLLLAPALFAETLEQCFINCPPGNNSCSQCCSAQYTTAAQPCYSTCQTAENVCVTASVVQCNNENLNPGQEQICVMKGQMACQLSNLNCKRVCNPDNLPGSCPGEMLPQKCPYTCMAWNPASQRCVGAPMNGC